MTTTWLGPRFIGPDGRHHEALCVTPDGRIAHLGSTRDGALRRLPEGYALPGLIDSHAHLGRLGQRPDALRFEATDRLDTIVDAVRGRAAALAPEAWILGRGWLDPLRATSADGLVLPDRRPLDRAAPDHPVALKRADEHALWVNTRALTLAGIDARTPDPEGGLIVRDDAGQPTGVLIDSAMRLVKSLVPPPPRELIEVVVREEAAAFLELGVTCVHEMAVDAGLLEALEALDQSSRLDLRVRAFLYAGDPHNHTRLRLPASPPGPQRLAVRGIKLFADGALGSRGARLSRPYADGGCGVRLDPPELMQAAARLAAAGGYQLAVHAIGDVALREAVDLIEAHQPGPHARWRIEHAQLVPGDALPRMARCGICAAVQPIHAAHDLPWAAPLLAERGLLEDAYRWQSLRRAGIPLALGTDHPIEDRDPRATLVAATTRATPGTNERLTRAQALDACWRGAAYLTFDEPWLAALTPGHQADFAVWDTDLTSCSPQALAEARCLAVVVGGQRVR